MAVVCLCVCVCLLVVCVFARYDPRHNSWCSVQPLQQQHADHAVCVLGGYIYAVGGRDYSNELDAVERYDPRTNAWEYVAPLKREVGPHHTAPLLS